MKLPILLLCVMLGGCADDNPDVYVQRMREAQWIGRLQMRVKTLEIQKETPCWTTIIRCEDQEAYQRGFEAGYQKGREVPK